MINIFKKNAQAQGASNHDNLVDTFVHIEQEVDGLPMLSDVERVQLEHDNAISHLYHSSKIEGTTLNQSRLEKAIAS